MWIKTKHGWELPERLATPEAVFRDRRRLIKTAAAGAILAPAILAPTTGMLIRPARAADANDPSAALYPFKRNEAYTLDRAITGAEWSTSYNNYYEFGSSKHIASEAQRLPLRPWMVKIDGMVEKPQEIAIDDLIKAMPCEERLYRHRCVEAWAMAVPWSGFPLKALVAMAVPAAGAKYVQFESFLDPAVAKGQKADWYPWPYIEGLTMAEAVNDLAFLVTGMYGKPAPQQNGAPLRLVTPWKYGFKSAKGIQRITFTDKRPKTFWETVQDSEYGFWANVNPDVPHPRWSQATERLLGVDGEVPTQIFNGYGAFVADLYKGLENEPLFR